MKNEQDDGLINIEIEICNEQSFFFLKLDSSSRWMGEGVSRYCMILEIV